MPVGRPKTTAFLNCFGETLEQMHLMMVMMMMRSVTDEFVEK